MIREVHQPPLRIRQRRPEDRFLVRPSGAWIARSAHRGTELRNGLACLLYIEESSKPIEIQPLPHTYVVKDRNGDV